MRDIDDISGDVINAVMQLHRDLGPGLLESVYEILLASKLARLGYRVERQLPINIEYDGQIFNAAFKIDLIVDGRLIVEVKSVEPMNAVHQKQLLTHFETDTAARRAALEFRRRYDEGGYPTCRQ